MRVYRASWLSWAAFLALIASFAGGTPPPRPSSFFGTVTAGGNAAPAGTAVSAWIGGVQYAEATVFAADGTSVYRLDVPADLPGTPAVEGGQPGQTVVFKVGAAQVSQSAAWQEGTVVRLDLTAPLGPDVSVSVDDGMTQAVPGDTLTYTINVINHGPGTAAGVTVRDTLSPATAFVYATDGGTATGGAVIWPAFDLAEGQSATRTVTAKVSASVPADLLTITNVATAFDDGTQGVDRKPDDNTDVDVDALNAAADLAVTVSNGVSQVLPGQRLEYRITVANDGNRDAAGVVLRNTLPDGITFFAASDSGAESGATVTWPAFDLAGGASVVRSFTVRVDDPLSPGVRSLSDTAEAGDATGTDLDPVVQKADLVASAVDAAGSITDPQTLAISGSVSIEVANEGNLDAADDFALAVFEDRDGNGSFTAAADNLLGQANVSDPLAAGDSLSVPVAVSGSVLFAENRILAFVDSLNAIAEHDESNNVGYTVQGCGPVTTQTVFSPVPELTWPPDTSKETVIDSASSPVVVDLDLNGVPDIVFTTANFDPPLGTLVPSMLRAIRGDTGAKIFDVAAPFEGISQYDFAQATVAVGNLDNDPFPEIVAAHVAGSLHSAPFNVIRVYEHTGTLKWKSAPYSTHPAGGATNRDNPAIADVDRDGVPEIVVGAHVFNSNDGTLRWKGTGGQAFQSIFNNEGVASGTISLVADLDLTGDPEIVTGNTAYRSNGSIYWQIPLDDGYPAVANFDGDPFPEIVVVARGRVRLHEHDGTLIWGPVVLPGSQPMAGGAPTIADFDADGEPEIGVAGSSFYTVFESDGSVKWQRPTKDVSSGMTGSTVFDFDGDGRFEVVYRDEEYLRIYNGEDGDVLAQLAVNSSTLNEEPVVADVDGDGNAEILVTSDHGDTDSGVPGTPTNAGLRVFGDANDNWVGTRRLWNQHAYSVGNVNDDVTIPREPDWSWLSHNTYRAQIAPERQTFALPDLSVSYARADLSAYPVVKVTARVGNGGDAVVRTELPVAFFNGSTLLGTVKTTKALKPGEYEDVTFTYTSTDFTARTIVIAADDNGAGASRESECDEANNRYTYTYDLSILGLTLSMSDGLSTVLVGETVTYTLSVFNANNHEAMGVALTDTLPANTTLVSADGGGTLSGGAVTWPPFTLAPGATATRSLTLQVSESTPTTVTEIVNQAAVTDDGSHGPDPMPANNSATDRNRIASLRADAGGPYEVNEGTAVTFTAAASRDRDGSIGSYQWDLDADGAYDDATGVTASRTYADEVSFTVAVKVTDNSGETATDTAPVTVRNAAPVVAAGADRKVTRGDSLSLTATFTDAGTGDAQTATIEWGDGTPVQAGAVTKTSTPWRVTGSHVFAADGVYTATVCVADNDGGLGCDSFLATVGDGWLLLGTSNDTARPGCIQITNGSANRTGAAWYSEKIDLAESFDKTFKVYLGNRDAADGMAFVLQNAPTGTSSIGAGGGWLAYRGIKPSIALEMDTWNNGTGGGFADIPEDHIAVDENGTLDHRGFPPIKMPNLEDGKEHLLRVIWNGPGKTLDVHWDGAELLLYSKDLINRIFAGNSEVHWGLTSASGFIGNEQYFCETAPCAPGVTPLISVGDVRLTENAFATVTASFPVTLSCAAGQEVRVDAATMDGSAFDSKDYEARSETLVFQPGETSKALAVTVLGDPYAEYTEQFYVDLARPQGGTLRYERGVGTILEEAWTVLGTTNTEVRPGCFRFTDGNWNQGGTVWHQRKIDLTKSFDKTFRVYVGHLDQGVDGLAFILQNAATGTSSIGPTGGYLAYGHIEPSIAIEVDTFRNTTDYGDGWKFIDPAPDHLAVNENGTLDHRGHAPVALPDIEDGREHLLRIVWNAASLTLDVYFDGVKRLVYSKNLIDQIFAGQTQVYWGLSGASGDGGAEQYACDTAACEPDGAAAISIGGADVQEQAFGNTVEAFFPVTLACAVDREVRVDYRTVDNSAAAGSDYVATTGTLVFAPGETSKTLVVPVVGDGLAEPTEQFSLDLSPAEGVLVAHGRGVGTIADGPLNTNPGTLQLSSPVYQVGEEGASGTIQVVRQGGAYGQVSVAYSTADGTATAPADYGSVSGTITFANGDSAPKTFQIPIVNDGDDEPDETIQVQLADPAGGASLGTVSASVLTIQDDDESSPAELSAHKTAEFVGGDGTPSPGDELLYTIAITNSGGSPATQVVLTDEVPRHTSLVAGLVTASAGTVISENPVKVEIAEIGSGETVTVSFRVAIDNPVPAGVKEISNQGAVTSAELPSLFTDDPVPGGGSDPTVTMITAAPKLVAEKTDALVEPDGVAEPGDEIEYKVAILNTGNTSATNVVFEDGIPQHTSLVPGSVQTSSGTVESEDPVRVAIGEIAGGERVEVTVRVKIENPIATGVREVSNQGEVTSRELPKLYTDDTAVGGSEDPTVTAVSAAPVLRVEKTDFLLEDVDRDKAASPGDTVLYKITVTNDGNTGATGVVLTDPLSAAVLASLVQTDQGTVESEDPVRVAIGEIAAGATVTVSFQVRIDDAFPYTATELVNQATVESGELEDVKSDDPDTPEAADPTRTPVFITPEIAIGDITVEEDEGEAILTVTLSKAGNREVPVSWSTGAGTALAGADFTVSSGILAFAPGETSKTLTVPILDDLIDELDEVFPVDLDGDEGMVTILDNDAPPQVSVADASVTEGDEGTLKAVFVVSLSGPSGLGVTLSYATADGTARAGLDYQAASGTVTIPAGATSATIEVDVKGDVIDENDETFTVTLANAVFAVVARAEATGNILDDDEALVSIGDAAVEEGNGGTAMLRMPVTLSTPAEREIRVDFTVAPGTATEGVDYDSVSGTVVFASGETSRFVDVPVRGDVLLESDETLFVDLSGSGIEDGIADGIEDGRGVGTIRDDEVCAGPELLGKAGDVDVSAFGAGQLFRFSGLVRTASEDPADVARIVVEYRDASNTVVLDAFDTGEIASPAEWRAVIDEREAPAGTAFIRVTLTGDGEYFDGLSLVSLKTATLTVGDVTLYEENTGTAQALFPVRLSCPVGADVATTYSTADGTALAGQDYLSTSGTLSLPAGTTEVTMPVTVLGDDVHELHETFRVLIGDASPEWVVRLDPAGVGTILNDDFCARSPGFWKTHPELWPVQSLVIGGAEQDAAVTMALLSYNGPDASNHLARQLVATELNLLVGSAPSILPVVGQAHALLAAHPPGSKPAGALKEQVNAVKDQLDQYNNSGCEQDPVIPGS